MKKKADKTLSLPRRIGLRIINSKICRVVPDIIYLKVNYRLMMNEKLNLHDPKTFNEKLQWLKLYNRNPIYTQLVDKYEVRKYISEKIGAEYLIPLLGVWNRFEEINFSELPNEFVLKCTHDSGSVIICRDKSSLDMDAARNKINRHMQNNFFNKAREWPYKNVKPRIICEKFLENKIKDYKFYCFNGNPKYLYVSQGMDNHKTARVAFFDMNFNKAPFGRTDYLQFEEEVDKPQYFDEMVEISRILSSNIPFVRVDLYQVGDRIYFSELTFFPRAGYMPFEPKEYDRILGDLLELPQKHNL